MARTDRALDAGLRPPRLDDFVGQPRTVERLRVMIGALNGMPARRWE